MAEKRSQTISEALIDTIVRRLSADLRVRRTLPRGGRIHVDRQLPLLCVYRKPHDRSDVGTARLVKGEAAYLTADAAPERHPQLAALTHGVAETMSRVFGAFLLLEIWSDQEAPAAVRAPHDSPHPKFQILAPRSKELSRTIDVLAIGLRKISVLKRNADVEVHRRGERWPEAMAPLLTADQAAELNCSMIGLVVPPVYRESAEGPVFPHILRSLHRSLGLALKQMFFEFSHSHTAHRPPHFHELGRRAVVRAVWEADRRLSEVSNAFDFLLQLTPINSDSAWEEFRRAGFTRAPVFHYLPTPYDPGELKRRLYQIPVDRVEDPLLQHLFQEKQEELDRKITMLRDRETPRFLFGSLQLYGAVDADQVRLAQEIIDNLAPAQTDSAVEMIDGKAFATLARAELEHYRSKWPGFDAKVEVTRNAAGVMISRGSLLINPGIQVSGARAEGLLQHEIGTHLLTYFNGTAQPFRQLASGLTGYEELQEGLAVLAEYLVGSLSPGRLRQLAARVLAAKMLVDGAGFVETFHHLQGCRLPPRTAFTITMRIYRGGGFTKDAIYLRGLNRILEYVGQGGAIEPLFLGRVGVHHVPMVQELQLRKVLVPAPVQPRYLEDPEAMERLELLRRGPTTTARLIESIERNRSTPPDRSAEESI